MIRPTPRAVLVFAIGIPPALFLVIFQPGLWLVSFDYAALALLAILADGASALFPWRVTVETAIPQSVQIGERGTIAATITARLRRRTAFELVGEMRGDLDEAGVVEAAFAPGELLRVGLPVIPKRRGRVWVDAIWVRWRSPLKLVSFTRRIGVNKSLDVVPNVRGVHSAALQFFAREAIFGVKVQQQKGEGAEFDALREYASGLDNRFIDWKHSARHRKLLCKEFRTERNHHVVLAFDTGHLMIEPVDGMPRLDHAINAGMLLAWISLKGGDLVGTYGFDATIRHYRQPVRGISSFSHVQRATADLDYHHQETNFTLGLAELSARLKRRALVILFTDFADTVMAELLIEATERVAARHPVIFVTLRDSVVRDLADAEPRQFEDVAKAVIAHDFLRDRSIVFERLARLGVHCLDVPSASLPVGLINRYLFIKQRGLI